MIRAIIFDCFGVLTTDTWRAFIDSLPEAVDDTKARELNRQYDAGLIDKAEFLDGVRQVTGHEPEQVEELLDNEITKNTVLLSYIKELKQSYKIGMISNIATPWITDSFLTADEQKLFDVIVASFEIGVTKPDPRIYQFALDRLGVEPSEAVFIDDIDGYVAAAKALGIQGVVYADFRQMKTDLETILSR